MIVLATTGASGHQGRPPCLLVHSTPTVAEMAGYACSVSQVERVAAREKVGELSDDDRGWLDERLAEYAELLEYLHDH